MACGEIKRLWLRRLRYVLYTQCDTSASNYHTSSCATISHLIGRSGDLCPEISSRKWYRVYGKSSWLAYIRHMLITAAGSTCEASCHWTTATLDVRLIRDKPRAFRRCLKWLKGKRGGHNSYSGSDAHVRMIHAALQRLGNDGCCISGISLLYIHNAYTTPS